MFGMPMRRDDQILRSMAEDHSQPALIRALIWIVLVSFQIVVFAKDISFISITTKPSHALASISAAALNLCVVLLILWFGVQELRRLHKSVGIFKRTMQILLHVFLLIYLPAMLITALLFLWVAIARIA